MTLRLTSRLHQYRRRRPETIVPQLSGVHRLRGLLRCDVIDRYRAGDSAAYIERTHHRHFSRLKDFDQVVGDRVDDAFIEDAFIAIGVVVKLEALHFDAPFVRDVAQGDGGEIGLAGHGANAGEFREDEFDLVVAGGPGVFKDFQNRSRLVDLGWRQVGAGSKLGDPGSRGLRVRGIRHEGILYRKPARIREAQFEQRRNASQGGPTSWMDSPGLPS